MAAKVGRAYERAQEAARPVDSLAGNALSPIRSAAQRI